MDNWYLPWIQTDLYPLGEITEKQSWIESRLWVNSLQMISVEHDIFLPLEFAERHDSSLPHCLSVFFSSRVSFYLCVFVFVCIAEVVVTHCEHSCKTTNVPQGKHQHWAPEDHRNKCTLTYICRDFVKVLFLNQSLVLRDNCIKFHFSKTWVNHVRVKR